MKKLLVSAIVLGIMTIVFVSVRSTEAVAQYAVDINGSPLHDGDVISANQSAGDPDIYIVGWSGRIFPGNILGYKRLFLNPEIFNMYGHLGGFAKVRQVTAEVRDSFVTSGLFRNCETNDQKIWATEITGEDSSVLHHVQMTGDQANAEDPYFFGKVFCINTREENSYVKSITPYYRLADIPTYFRRMCIVRPACLDAVPRCMIPEPSTGWCPSPSQTPYCETAGQTVPSSGNLCCPGLTQVPIKDSSGEVISGMNSWMCAQPGCYYLQVYCANIQAPCNPVLVCPTATPMSGY